MGAEVDVDREVVAGTGEVRGEFADGGEEFVLEPLDGGVFVLAEQQRERGDLGWCALGGHGRHEAGGLVGRDALGGEVAPQQLEVGLGGLAGECAGGERGDGGALGGSLVELGGESGGGVEVDAGSAEEGEHLDRLLALEGLQFGNLDRAGEAAERLVREVEIVPCLLEGGRGAPGGAEGGFDWLVEREVPVEVVALAREVGDEGSDALGGDAFEVLGWDGGTGEVEHELLGGGVGRQVDVGEVFGELRLLVGEEAVEGGGEHFVVDGVEGAECGELVGVEVGCEHGLVGAVDEQGGSKRADEGERHEDGECAAHENHVANLEWEFVRANHRIS